MTKDERVLTMNELQTEVDLSCRRCGGSPLAHKEDRGEWWYRGSFILCQKYQREGKLCHTYLFDDQDDAAASWLARFGRRRAEMNYDGMVQTLIAMYRGPLELTPQQQQAIREAGKRLGFDPECPGCLETGMRPSHNGSRSCESGSLASGGKNAHCTCDTCF